ncbi:sensor histidine kinase [Liquorilactobacillus vini]|uniref:sensor histidine kinase n=1 Tax=Liquorilactobacillus vini TaxID=238015 RepID=UPI00031910FE|nr:HAMP domain-containing sensor histidine kinase [Liquorilactobacillus vini]
MKLIYQQMLAFFTIIVLLLTLLGIFFFQLTKSLIYENTWNQLEGYAYSLKTDAMSETQTSKGKVIFSLDSEKLQNYELLLQNQEVHFTIYTSRNRVLYPQTMGFQSIISKKDWRKLKKGNIIRRKNDLSWKRGPGDFKEGDRQQQKMTDILAPCFDQQGDLVAVISVGAKVSSLEESFAKIQRSLIYMLLISAAIGVAISYLVAHYTTKRIRQLQRATRQVASGNFNIQIPNKDRDEIDDLANDFNSMTFSLKKSEKEIKRQEEQRRQFMADAAHEMRTPLTTINGLLEGLAYDAIPEESKAKSIELMRNETKRLIRLVNENLDYEKIRSGQILLKRQNFEAMHVLHNIQTQLRKKAQSAGDTLEVTGPNKLNVFADYDRFVQVIFNVTQNAIQFTQNGNIQISAEKGFESTIFRISDTGIGMTPEQLKNIWERYYKADASRKNTKYGESGLGLAIVQQLMQLHHGKVEVISHPDQGTTFTLIFPDEKLTNDKV